MASRPNLNKAEVLKVSNQFQQVVFTKFNVKQIDLFWVIASRVAERGTETVSIDFDELRKAINLKKKMGEQEFRELLRGLNKALLETSFEFEDDEKVYQFTLFDEFDTYKKEPKLDVSVKPRFAFLLNGIVSNYTLLDVKTIVSLRSRYAKDAYRHMRQYRTTGVWRIGLDEFYEEMGIPEESRNTIYLNLKVLKPIEEELGAIMGLHIERFYSWPEGTSAHRGRKPLSALAFHFVREQPRVYSAEQKDVMDAKYLGEYQPAAKAKAKKNALPPAIDYDRGEGADAKAARKTNTSKTSLQMEALAAINRERGTDMSLNEAAKDPDVCRLIENYVSEHLSREAGWEAWDGKD